MKAGQPAFIHIDPAYIESILPVQLAWLRPFIPFMQAVDLDVSDLCAVEPPGYPTFTAEDLINLVAPSRAGVAFTAGMKMAQLAHQLLWYLVCECNAPDPSPTLPSGPAAPAEAPTINPSPIVALPSAVPCYTNSTGVNTFGPGGGNNGAQHSVFPTTRSTVRWRVTTAVVTAPGPKPTITLNQIAAYGNTSTNVRQDVYTLNAGQTLDVTRAIEPTVNILQRVLQMDATAGLTSEQATIDVYCNGEQPGGLVNCGTDPRLIPLLEKILGVVTVLQRFHVPFGYIDGTVHNGLAGSGTIAVERLIGIRVEITSYPPTTRSSAGNPAYKWDLGWVSVSDPDGMLEEKRVSQLEFYWLPRMGQLATQVNYFLPPDVVATIVELEPESEY